ncbi:MAG: ribbon-helix-helix domain-containing protein [Candidatus Jordarchaeales archaeon]
MDKAFPKQVSGSVDAGQAYASADQGKINILILYKYIMTPKVIPIKLRDELVENIDELVKKGLFRSRNEAIRRILSVGLTTFSREFDRKKAIAATVNRLLLLDKKLGQSPVSLKGIRSQLLEARERL